MKFSWRESCGTELTYFTILSKKFVEHVSHIFFPISYQFLTRMWISYNQVMKWNEIYSLYGRIWQPNNPLPPQVWGFNSTISVLITSTTPPNSIVFRRTATEILLFSLAVDCTNSAMARNSRWLVLFISPKRMITSFSIKPASEAGELDDSKK